MKSKYFFIFFVAVICIYFLLRKDKNQILEPTKLSRSSLAKNEKENPVKIGDLAKNETQKSEKSSEASGDIQSEVKEDDCYTRLKSQLINSNFMNQHSDEFKKVVGLWYLQNNIELIPSNASINADRFYLALTRAHLLASANQDMMNVKKDEESALKLLNELMQLDPDNSAPIIFAALIEKNRGRLDQSKKLLSKIDSTKYYNSYMSEVVKAVFSKVETTEDYVYAIEIVSQLPIPKYSNFAKLFENVNPTKIVDQLTQNALSSEKILPEAEWVPIEYAMGKLLNDKYKIGKVLPATSELYDAKINLRPESVRREDEEYQKSCDVRAFEKSLAFMKSRKF